MDTGGRLYTLTLDLMSSSASAVIDSHEELITDLMLERTENPHNTVIAHKLEEMERQLATFHQRFSYIKQSISDTNADFAAERARLDRECSRLNARLPMYAYQQDIIEMVKANQVSVIVGDTGSGKSTQLCQYLYENNLIAPDKVAVCTQPRKIAATSLAERVSSEMRTDLGDVVGYQVGMKRHFTDKTKIIYSTDHCLLNECLKDPLFTKYSVLVIDEAHERSIHTDLLLGLIKSCLPQRPDLKVIVTSATIDPKLFQDYFNGCPMLSVPGRMYPVEVLYEEDHVVDPIGYISSVVEKVKTLHAKPEPGDILAFLVTPNDCERGVELIGDLDNAVCLPLHGQVKPEKYNSVLEPLDGPQRKIVFATNCAETSVTIPGIKFVVDSGLAKEKQYDSKRNIGKLVVTKISKSSANQRKGRAGRVEAGQCYRLYSEKEYQDMSELSAPEILRVSLSQAVLHLLALGIRDPLKFDFVQSPSKESLRKSYDLLKQLGAIDVDGRLSDLGRQMVHLPCDPKLSKFLLICCGEGLGYCAVVLASLLTYGNQIFYYAGTDEEKQALTAKKAVFVQPDGEVFTLLKVYKKWKAAGKAQKKWCFDNGINSKMMKNVSGMIEDIIKILKNEFDIWLQVQEVDDGLLQDVLYQYIDCYYPDHICFYSGDDRVGYYVPQIDEYCPVHPSSSFTQCGTSAKVAVFENVLQTNRKYLITVTSIENLMSEHWAEDWFNQTYQGQLVGTYPVSEYGPAVQKELYSNRFNIKNLLETVYHDRNLVPMVQWSAPSQPRLVSIITSTHDHLQVLELLRIQLEQPAVTKLLNASKDVSIEGKSDVKVILGAGGEVIDFLMPTEYTSVEVTLERAFYASELDVGKMQELLEPFGPVMSMKMLANKTELWGYVNFVKPESAEKAVNHTFDKFTCSPAKAPSSRNSQAELDGFKGSIRFDWLRKPSRDHAYIQTDIDVSNIVGDTFPLGSHVCSFVINRRQPGQVMIKGLSEDTTVPMIKTKGPAILNRKEVKIIIPSLKPVNSDSGQDYESIQGLLLPALTSAGIPHICLRILRNPQQTDPKVISGFINPTSFSAYLALSNELNKQEIRYQGRLVKFSVALEYTLRISKVVYNKLEQHISQLAKLLAIDAHFKPYNRSPNAATHGLLICKSDNKDNLGRFQQEVSIAITGHPVDCSDMYSSVLLSPKYAKFLEQVEEKTGVSISKDVRESLLRLFGSPDEISKAISEIDGVKRSLKSSEFIDCCISLRASGRPPGLLKQVLKKYRANLAKLSDIEGCHSVNLDIRQHEILFIGTKMAYTQICKKVDKLALSTPRLGLSTSGECPVCLVEVDAAKVQLSLCGHAYCKDCFQGLSDSNIKDRKFPFTCVSEGCDKPLLLRDLDDKDVKLVNSAVAACVQRRGKEFKFCQTADCNNVYRITKTPRAFYCSLCMVATCTCCHKNAHSNEFECADLADGDQALKKWMAEDSNNRKQCPKCRQGIEKNGGCLHVTCTNCGAHICWNCMVVFSTGDQVYSHPCSASPNGRFGFI